MSELAGDLTEQERPSIFPGVGQPLILGVRRQTQRRVTQLRPQSWLGAVPVHITPNPSRLTAGSDGTQGPAPTPPSGLACSWVSWQMSDYPFLDYFAPIGFSLFFPFLSLQPNFSASRYLSGPCQCTGGPQFILPGQVEGRAKANRKRNFQSLSTRHDLEPHLRMKTTYGGVLESRAMMRRPAPGLATPCCLAASPAWPIRPRSECCFWALRTAGKS